MGVLGLFGLLHTLNLLPVSLDAQDTRLKPIPTHITINPGPAILSSPPCPSLQLIPPPTPPWTYDQRIDATLTGKEWVAGESAGWKVYDTAKTDETYVLLDLFNSDMYKLLIPGIVSHSYPRSARRTGRTESGGVKMEDMRLSRVLWL